MTKARILIKETNKKKLKNNLRNAQSKKKKKMNKER